MSWIYKTKQNKTPPVILNFAIFLCGGGVEWSLRSLRMPLLLFLIPHTVLGDKVHCTGVVWAPHTSPSCLLHTLVHSPGDLCFLPCLLHAAAQSPFTASSSLLCILQQLPTQMRKQGRHSCSSALEWVAAGGVGGVKYWL